MPTFTGCNTAMLRAAVIDGGDAATDLPVAGLAPEDTLLLVLHQDADGLLQADLAGEASCPAPGSLRLAATDTGGDRLLVIWLDVSAAEA